MKDFRCGGHLNGLQLSDGRSEGRAFVGVVGGAVQGGLSDAERLSGDADPAAVQRLLRAAESES